MPIYNPASATSNLTVLKNGLVVGTRPSVNLIEGANIALTVTDNPGASEVDTTIASSAGGAQVSGAMVSETLSTYTEGSVTAETTYFQGLNFTGTAVWPAANRAIYVSVQVAKQITAYQMFWQNGATVGTNTVDVGIYNSAGTLLVSSGATLTAGVSTVQVVNITDTVLTPDTYFIAMIVNGITDTFARVGLQLVQSTFSGVQDQDVGAATLPGTAVLSALGQAYIPLFGAVYQSSVF